jgi:hypothetical protein
MWVRLHRSRLRGGRGLAAGEQADAIAGKLTELGGDVEAHEVTDEALEAVATAAPAATEVPAASA